MQSIMIKFGIKNSNYERFKINSKVDYIQFLKYYLWVSIRNSLYIRIYEYENRKDSFIHS